MVESVAVGESYVLFLINRWSSASGGIQTVNRKLSIAIASRSATNPTLPKVMCLAEHASDDERSEAASRGVVLLQARSCARREDDERVITYMHHPVLEEITAVAVSGHAKFTGAAAKQVRDVHFPDAVSIVFIHMDPEETEALKEGWLDSALGDALVKEAERRTELEWGCAGEADLVLGVGPRLKRRAQDAIAARARGGAKVPTIAELLCGMDEYEPRKSMPQEPLLLALGRTDHIRIKGLDIFADAAGVLVKKWYDNPALRKRPVPRFLVRGGGADADALQADLRERAQKAAGRQVHLTVKPYTQDDASLANDLWAASLVVVASRAEGFGLVALEAASLGVPFLVNKWSGLGEMIGESLPPAMLKEPLLLELKLNDDGTDADLVANKALELLHEPDWTQNYALEVREQLLRICSWDEGAKTFLNQVALATLR